MFTGGGRHPDGSTEKSLELPLWTCTSDTVTRTRQRLDRDAQGKDTTRSPGAGEADTAPLPRETRRPMAKPPYRSRGRGKPSFRFPEIVSKRVPVRPYDLGISEIGDDATPRGHVAPDVHIAFWHGLP